VSNSSDPCSANAYKNELGKTSVLVQSAAAPFLAKWRIGLTRRIAPSLHRGMGSPVLQVESY
jgi:hypothetical protein